MATIPPVIEAALRSPQMPPKVKIFLQGLEVLIPGELPARSRGPVSAILSEISTDLKALAATASTSIGSARTTIIISSLSRSLRAWESQLHAAFILKPSPFDPLLAKHILIGSGSYLREVQKAREVFEQLQEDVDNGEMGAEMSDTGRDKVSAILARVVEIVGTIEKSVKDPEMRRDRNKMVMDLIDGDIQKLVGEWKRAWKEDWGVWCRFWSL